MSSSLPSMAPCSFVGLTPLASSAKKAGKPGKRKNGRAEDARIHSMNLGGGSCGSLPYAVDVSIQVRMLQRAAVQSSVL
jgi:hypothetical protein